MAARYAQIEALDVVLGEPLPWDVYNRVGILLYKRGAMIQRPDQLNRLLLDGIFTVESELVETRQLRIATEPVEIPSAWLKLAEARKAIEGSFAACRAKTADFPQRIAALVQIIDEAVEISGAVCIAAMTLKTEGSYARRHPVDCAALVRMLCDAGGLPTGDRHSLMAAALTMNFSRFTTQDTLNQIPAVLTPEQKQSIATHPAESRAMLEDAGITDGVWLQAVAHHHEQFDGYGYPDGLKAGEIGDLTQILTLADWFTARLQTRADRAAQIPAAAVNLAQNQAKRCFSPSLPLLLARTVGIYPAGSFVKLANGEIAVVAKQTANPQTPQVFALKSPRSVLHNPVPRETSLDIHTVREPIHPNQFHLEKPLKLTDIWGKDAEGG